MKYRVTTKNEAIVVQADNIESAALRFAKRHFDRRAYVMRTTGTVRLSGYFQAYKPLRGSSTSTSIGNPFHVKEDNQHG